MCCLVDYPGTTKNKSKNNKPNQTNNKNICDIRLLGLGTQNKMCLINLMTYYTQQH